MTPEEFTAYAQALLDQFTPNELFDFMNEQGAFDHLKKQPALSFNLEFGKTLGQIAIDLSLPQADLQLIAA